MFKKVQILFCERGMFIPCAPFILFACRIYLAQLWRGLRRTSVEILVFLNYLLRVIFLRGNIYILQAY